MTYFVRPTFMIIITVIEYIICSTFFPFPVDGMHACLIEKILGYFPPHAFALIVVTLLIINYFRRDVPNRWIRFLYYQVIDEENQRNRLELVNVRGSVDVWRRTANQATQNWQNNANQVNQRWARRGTQQLAEWRNSANRMRQRWVENANQQRGGWRNDANQAITDWRTNADQVNRRWVTQSAEERREWAGNASKETEKLGKLITDNAGILATQTAALREELRDSRQNAGQWRSCISNFQKDIETSKSNAIKQKCQDYSLYKKKALENSEIKNRIASMHEFQQRQLKDAKQRSQNYKNQIRQLKFKLKGQKKQLWIRDQDEADSLYEVRFGQKED